MGRATEKTPFSEEQFNTLAQSGTDMCQCLNSKPEKLVYGNGSDLSEVDWGNRSRRKVISQAMILALIDVAKEKGDFDRVQAYWNTYHCLSHVTVCDDKVYGKYCKNRFCIVCLGIRKAELINKYYPIISTWEEPYFVTLTTKAQPARNLEKWMRGMKEAFRLIKNRCDKRYQRGKGVKLVGIKSLECNFNPKNRTYNPHYHLIVANKEIAHTLVVEWQKQWNRGPKKLARPFAQHMRKVENLERDLIEAIKYGSKIFTEPDVMKKSRQKGTVKLYVSALDNIFVAMKPYRLFDRFGFNLPKENLPQNHKTVNFLKNYDELIYNSYIHDWVDPYSGELLTEYVLDHGLENLLNNGINKELC